MSDQITEKAERVWDEIQRLTPEADTVPLSLAFTDYQNTLDEWFELISTRLAENPIRCIGGRHY